jgi:hypothetical protein
MPLLQVYDPPMCCPSGACGPDPDPELSRVAGDLAWLGRHGVEVERHNLGQEPAAFVENPAVLAALKADDTACLPIVLADGVIVARGSYPSREALLEHFGLVEEGS